MSDSRTHRASRTILAPPRAIYRAFLDAEAVASWRPPSGMTARVERFVPKIGGGYRMAFIYPEDSAEKGKSGSGKDIFEGRFVDLIPDQRIVEAVTFQSDDPAFAGTMTITATIERKRETAARSPSLPRMYRPAFPRRITVKACLPHCAILPISSNETH